MDTKTTLNLLWGALASSETPEDGAFVKRLDPTAPLPELLYQLTQLERRPRLPAQSHRGVALTKMVLSGHEDREAEFVRWAQATAGL